MKRKTSIRLAAFIMIMIMTVSIFSPVMAGTSTGNRNQGYDNTDPNSLPPFKFKIHDDGIGYGVCPVYTAPSEDAFRCADGRAVCDTNAKMDDAGFVSGWLLVRYETNSGSYRVGYIPPRYVRGFKSEMYPHFGYIPAVADETIYVTDNPMMHGTSFARLDQGESFHILSKYDYYKRNGFEWWYIECVVDGQLAYGFIEMSSGFTLGSGTGY